MNYPTLIYFVGFHLWAVWALVSPATWQPDILPTYPFVGLAIGYSCGLGVTAGYHRLLVHGSFETYSWLRSILATLGMLAGQHGPISWAAIHRAHHALADDVGDPHTPRHGLAHAHYAWMLRSETAAGMSELRKRWAPDLLNDPALLALESTPVRFGSQALLALILYAIGGWPLLAWGVPIRVVVAWHLTWVVNSLCHLPGAGYRNHETNDDSVNVWMLALPTLGEANHNNHHAAQRRADHGRRWFEFDPTWRFIQLLQLSRLAWNVVRS